MAVSNYNPLWIDVLKDASVKEVILPIPSGKIEDAASLRQKLYRLRKAMEREEHEAYKMVAKVTIHAIYVTKDGREVAYINNRDTPVPTNVDRIVLRLLPQDLKFAGVLEQAGYKIPDTPEI